VPSRAVGSRRLCGRLGGCAQLQPVRGVRKLRLRRLRVAAAGGIALVAAGCGAGGPVLSVAAKQRFLDSVYGQAPDISSYRTGTQLISMGQAVCADLSSGASVQVVADRVPLVEGSNPLPPTYLGVVIYSAVRVFCPRFDKLLDQ
jgi:hypothetical protein